MDWKRITDTLTSTALKKLGSHAGSDYAQEAEDMAEEAVIRLLELGVIKEDAAFKLGTKIVVDNCNSHRRLESRRREIEQEYGAAINRNLTGQSAEVLAADPMEIMAYEEMKDRLDALSPLLYATVELHYIQGLPVREIADMNETTEDVIYKRLQRARDIVTGDNNDE